MKVGLSQHVKPALTVSQHSWNRPWQRSFPSLITLCESHCTITVNMLLSLPGWSLSTSGQKNSHFLHALCSSSKPKTNTLQRNSGLCALSEAIPTSFCHTLPVFNMRSFSTILHWPSRKTGFVSEGRRYHRCQCRLCGRPTHFNGIYPKEQQSSNIKGQTKFTTLILVSESVSFLG